MPIFSHIVSNWSYCSYSCNYNSSHYLCGLKSLIMASLATDLNTVDDSIKIELKKFAELVLLWVTEILTEGEKQKVFEFQHTPRTKALLIITNILAIVQLSRLTKTEDFEIVKEAIIKDLRPHK